MNRLFRIENDNYVIDIKGLFLLLFKRLPIIISATAICGLIAFFIAYYYITPQYKATVMLYGNNTTQQKNTTSLSSADLTASAKLVDTFSAIITSKSMLNDVINQAKVETENYQSLKGKITIDSINSTEVFTVSVVNPDPETAQIIVNTLAKLLPKKVSSLIKGCSVYTVDYAELPEKIDSPSYVKWTVIGAGIGLLLCVAIIIIITISDIRIHSETDLEEWKYPVLCSIPDLKGNSKTDYGYR